MLSQTRLLKFKRMHALLYDNKIRSVFMQCIMRIEPFIVLKGSGSFLQIPGCTLVEELWQQEIKKRERKKAHTRKKYPGYSISLQTLLYHQVNCNSGFGGIKKQHCSYRLNTKHWIHFHSFSLQILHTLLVFQAFRPCLMVLISTRNSC